MTTDTMSSILHLIFCSQQMELTRPVRDPSQPTNPFSNFKASLGNPAYRQAVSLIEGLTSDHLRCMLALYRIGTTPQICVATLADELDVEDDDSIRHTLRGKIGSYHRIASRAIETLRDRGEDLQQFVAEFHFHLDGASWRAQWRDSYLLLAASTA